MRKLKGKNQIRRFRQIAEALVSKIASREGVAGIVFVGGLVRGFADKYSDVDVTVFLSKKDKDLRKEIWETGLHAQERSRVDIDLEIHFLEDFRKWKWDETDKWDFSRADIVFDPQKEIEKLFREKMRVPKGFWTKRIAICSEYAKWYCCPPKDDDRTITEAWIDRGDMVSAHYCINYALDLLISIVFALNKEFLPSPKWKIFCSFALKWLPTDYGKLVEEAITVKNLSARDLGRRLRALRKMWREILLKIEDETGLTPKEISEYYVKKELHQS